MKIKRDKLHDAANIAISQLNATKEAIKLILLGANVNAEGVKVIEQKLNSAQESFNVLLNVTNEELNKCEKTITEMMKDE